MSMKSSTATTNAASSSRIAGGVAAALLGVFLLFGVGLANADALHNAAHDTRHAFTFPCH